MNENESYLFHVEQPSEWARAPEHFWIYGWFVSKNGITYTDIRAFIEELRFYREQVFRPVTPPS